MVEQEAATGMGNFKWDDLTKMLGGFLKKPENQRMMMDFIKPMTQKYDPRTGKMVGGMGTSALDTTSAMINREQVGKTAQAQAIREQLYRKQLLQALGQRGQPTQKSMIPSGDMPNYWGESELAYGGGKHPLLGG
jgi:hypothetical protein